jgi:hypothetical protein
VPSNVHAAADLKALKFATHFCLPAIVAGNETIYASRL